MWRLRQRLPLLLSAALVRRRDVCVVRYCSSGGGGSGADGDNGSVDCIQRTSALLRALVTPQRPHGVSNSGSGSDNNNATSPEVWQSACVLLRRLEAQLASVMHAQQQSGSSDTVATATVTTSAGVDSTRHRNTSSSTSSMHDVLQLLDAMLRVCMRAVVVAATQQQQQQHAHNTTLSDAALLDMCDDVYTTYHTCCLAYAHHCSSNNNTDGMPRRLQLRRCVLHIRYVRFMLAYNARTTSAAAAATTLERALCVLLLDVPALRASMTTMTAASPSSSSSSLSSVHTPTDMLLLTLAALQRALLLLPLHSCNSNSRHSLLSWLAQRDDTNSATATAAAAHDVCNALTLARTCVQQVLLRVHVPRHVKQCALARYCACCVAHAHAQQQQQHEERGSSNNAHQVQRMADMPVTFAWQQQSAVAATRSAAPHRDADNVDEAVVLTTALRRGVCEQLLYLTTDNTTTTRDDSGSNARRLRDEVMLTLLTRHRRAHVDDDDNNDAHSDGSGNSSHHAHTSRTHYSLGVWLLRALLAPLQRACAAAAGQQQQQRWECATRQTLQLLRPLMLCVSEAQRRLVAITSAQQQQQQQQQRDVQYVVQGMWRVLLDAVRDGVFALLLPTQQQQQQQQPQQQRQGDKRDSNSHTADTDTTMATSVCEAMRVLVLPLYDAPHWRRATVNVFVCLLHEWQQSSVLREVFREVQRRERHAQHRAWQHIDAHTRREEQQHDNDDQQQQQQQGNRQSGRRGGVVYVPALSLSSCELVIQHCCNTLHDPHTAAQAVHYMLLALRMAHSRVAARNDDDGDGDDDDGDSDNADMGVTQAAAAAIDTSVSNNNSDNNSRGAVDGNEDDDDEEDDVSMWLQRVKQQYIPAVDALFRRSGLDSDGGWLVRGRT